MSACSATPTPRHTNPAATANATRTTSSSTIGADSHLDTAFAEFRILTANDPAMAIDGTAIGHGLPHRMISLLELNTVLFHPSTPLATRDVVWRHLAGRARTGGQHWTVAAIGVAMPALRSMSARLVHVFHADRAEADNEVLIGFLAALQAVDLRQERVITRLCTPAFSAARRTLRRANQPAAHKIGNAKIVRQESADTSAEQDVLARAVTRGIISELAADIIAKTRLGKMSLSGYAEATGRDYFAVARCRSRGETRLHEAHKNGELAPDFDLDAMVLEETTSARLGKDDTGHWQHRKNTLAP